MRSCVERNSKREKEGTMFASEHWLLSFALGERECGKLINPMEGFSADTRVTRSCMFIRV